MESCIGKKTEEASVPVEPRIAKREEHPLLIAVCAFSWQYVDYQKGSARRVQGKTHTPLAYPQPPLAFNSLQTSHIAVPCFCKSLYRTNYTFRR